MIGNFYIVSTPIGNLDDMTHRAVKVLESVDLVLCEDTRVTQKLLNHYDIKNKTQSYHANSKLSKIESICEMLLEGKNIALVSDAGTPIISDPGALLVKEIYKKIPEVSIVPIPGASALLSALVISGLDVHNFLFLGFLPHKKGRETLFKKISSSEYTCVFYESVHRIIKTLESLDKVLEKDRKIVVVKEITKIYEERICGNSREVLEYFNKNKEKIKGEFVVMVEGLK